SVTSAGVPIVIPGTAGERVPAPPLHPPRQPRSPQRWRYPSVVPPDERSSKVLDRCDRHPGSPAVARCSGCGRPMCLACSTPVRGENFGSECLADVLGPDAGDTGDPSTPRPDRAVRWLALAAFGLAVLATALPWSRVRRGSRALGARSRAG